MASKERKISGETFATIEMPHGEWLKYFFLSPFNHQVNKLLAKTSSEIVIELLLLLQCLNIRPEMSQLHSITLRRGEIRAFIYYESEWTLPN